MFGNNLKMFELHHLFVDYILISYYKQDVILAALFINMD